MSSSLAQTFGIISAVIGVIALIPYYVDIIKGRTKPQRAAFLIFSVLATISFFGQYAEGATASLWFAFVLMASPYAILLLSIKRGVGGFARRDKISLALAVGILCVWYFTKSAALAVVLVVAVNTIAKYLVAAKVYELPYSDLLLTWVLSAIASVFAALSVGELDWILLLAPVQNAITVGIIALIIVIRRRQVSPPKGWSKKQEEVIL